MLSSRVDIGHTTPFRRLQRPYGSRTHRFPDASSVPGTCTGEGHMEALANGRGDAEALRRLHNDTIGECTEAFADEDLFDFVGGGGDLNCKKVGELTVAQHHVPRFWPVVTRRSVAAQWTH